MQKLLRYIFIGILLPVLVQYVCYYQFTTNYTTNAFSEESFRKMYGTTVYKSRIIGKELQLWTYEKLNGVEKLRQMAADENSLLSSGRLLHMDPTADPVFYFSCFLLAAIFSVLTALLLLRITEMKFFDTSRHWKDLAITCFILLSGLTQFVITPYDNPGYFFMALAILLFLRFEKGNNLLWFGATLLTIIIATFNRETSLLIISFMAAWYYTRKGLEKRWIYLMLLPALCFLLPYLFLKFIYGGGADITEESKIAVNLDPRNSYAIRGLAFGAFVLYFLLVILNWNRTTYTRNFLFFSLPYLLMIHAVGVMLEYRLWMPIILGGIVLSLLLQPQQGTHENRHEISA